MLTFNYKDVAKELSQKNGVPKVKYEKIQLGIFGLVKEAMLSTDLENETAKNIRIKRFGIFRASKNAIKYYKSKFK